MSLSEFTKLTPAQFKLLRAIGSLERRTAELHYKPAIRLVELGLAYRPFGSINQNHIFLTPAGRARYERGT